MDARKSMEASQRPSNWMWRLAKGHRLQIALGASALLLVDLLALIPPRMLGALVDSVFRRGLSWPPAAIAGAYIGSFFMVALVRYPMRMGMVGAAARISGELRTASARALVLMPHADLRSRGAGEWMSQITGDLGAVEDALSPGLLYLCDCLFYLLVIPGAMLLISPFLCAVALLALPAIAILSNTLVRHITHASEKTQQGIGRLSSLVLENAEAAQTVRSYGLEEWVKKALTKAGDSYVTEDLHRVKPETMFAAAVQTVFHPYRSPTGCW